MRYITRTTFPLILPVLIGMIFLFQTINTCQRFELLHALIVSTDSISGVTYNQCTAFGTIVDLGSDGALDHGFCWSIEKNPTTGDSTHTSNGERNSPGQFNNEWKTGLFANTTYYVRAYAVDEQNMVYGNELTFTTAAPVIPKVTTTAITGITDSSAMSGGELIDNGGLPVTARGVCWSTSSNPATSDNHTSDGNGTGPFTSELTNLDPETTYHVRAYATNTEGTAYGNEEEFTTLTPVNTLTDYDGNEYQVVKIGFQTWMAENLKVTHYSDGTPIPFVEDQTTWGNMEPEDKAYCYYDNNTAYGETYGALYTWAGALDGTAGSDLNPSGVQGVCPSGWHLPSDVEWKQMEMYLGMSQSEADFTRWRSTGVGGKLKETGTGHWKSPNTGATDEIGFSALPGGLRNASGMFLNRGLECYFWSSTDAGGTKAWYRHLWYERAEIYRDYYYWHGEGYSVRCVSDDVTATTPAVTTSSISGITENSAQSGGEITSDGGASVTARGICWSTSENPVLSDSHTTDGAGTGTFASSMTGLQCNTTYFLRAYATSSVGTAYGNQENFTTSPCVVDLPTVTTELITNITGESAQSGGEVTDEGGAVVTEKGICWSTSLNPTLSDSHTVDGSGIGGFTSSITGLARGTRYFVRAYATNSGGISYGNQPSFFTPDLPTVLTFDISNITDVSAQGGGNVTDGGGAGVTAKGVCWSTSQDPALSDTFTTDGTGLGSFTSTLSGLNPNTTYYVKTYATNMVGTQYGSEVNFKTLAPSGNTVTDYDGNTYQTVVIGDQTWMAENLKVTHYSDGTAIPLVEDSATWATLSYTDKAYCWYNNNEFYGSAFGALFTWPAIMNGAGSSEANPSGVQGVCPDGWHLPSDDEWKQLEMYLGMSQAEADGTDWRGADEGGKLKETGTTFWVSPNTGATNESGYTALPGGLRSSNGRFSNMGYSTSFWTASGYFGADGWYHSLFFDRQEVFRFHGLNYYGHSVRCVKDE